MEAVPFGNGRGKYDDVCSDVRERTEAVAVVLVVVDGNKGPGFSVQAPLIMFPAIAASLEIMAKQMREELTRFAPGGSSTPS